MKELQDLERELGRLEEDARKIVARLGQINADLGRLRAAEAPAGIDFSAVRRCAELYPGWNHPIMQTQNSALKELYPAAVLSLARWQEDADFHLLVFCQWLLLQSGSGKTLEDCLAASFRTDPELYGSLKRQIGGELRPMFLLDLLIGASLSGPASDGALEYIAELACLLGCDSQEMEMLSLAAQVMLRQSIEGLDRADLFTLSALPIPFRFYLPGKIWEDVRTGMRRIVLREDGSSRQIKWKKEQGEPVERGDVIAKVKANFLSSRSQKRMTDCSGVFFHFSRHDVFYGVVAGPDDNKDSLKNWVKKMEIGEEYE